ncbi:Transcriptional activator RfaH [Thioalkalivibrio nitratireducens DSM 14787]|uniref:Transcriptional activator RfaH n=1 Tax=Thioalkalivibrio nitratireducens (strain DSM 14787 / UNIQEM 213 / ALEN2) TaxID=1255043 RepID=L0DRY9_THIND|nr:transcriptional activator RfaH [Thioalkalivibrio nitratireducens]AGA31773.1 Transcriptional activator RfaH [Thioalkalivibrio nitratireducens DSM 14787]
MKHWYAVHCKPNQDERAEDQLRNQGFEVFRPRIRCRRRARQRYRAVIESMFPRYLFVELDDASQDWSPIRSTRGVTGLVRMGGRIPHVPDPVIDALRRRVDADDCIEITPEEGFQPNQPVLITEGPLAGFQALFKARNSQERVVVLLNLMQVTLPVHAITRA